MSDNETLRQEAAAAEPQAEPVAEAAAPTVDDAATGSSAEPMAGAHAAEGDGDTTESHVDESDKPARRGTPRTRLEDLVVGTEAEGKVMALAKFGVFVDIGAVTDGLVHVSEFPKRRGQKMEDTLSQGDVVQVWVKDVDVGGNRISLSMRERPVRPMRQLHTGDVLTGTVMSVMKYGAFVDIGAETEGLVHVSEMSSGFVDKPGEVVQAGQPVEVRIKEVDVSRERISLSMVGLANDMGLEVPEGEDTDEEQAAEPEERTPTVVELALRKALGEMQDADEHLAAAEPSDSAEEAPEPTRRDRDSLGEVYERMLAEYRASKDDA